MQGKQKICRNVVAVPSMSASGPSRWISLENHRTHVSALGHPPSDRFPQTNRTFERLFLLLLAFPGLTLLVGVVVNILTLSEREEGDGGDDDLQDLLEWEDTRA